MSLDDAATAADPDDLLERLPAPPGAWERVDSTGGIVEYRLAGEAGVCAAAKVTVRPDPLSAAAVRVDRTRGCASAGTTRHDDVERAVAAVRAALENADTN